jgi:CTP:molybdopterin cytidylyltransferase MocA
MGRPKLLLPFGSTTILGSTVAALRGGGMTEIVLVTGADDEETASWAASLDLRWTVNPRPAEAGMLTSVWAGIAALGGVQALLTRGAPLFVCPGDLPLLRAPTVTLLRDEARKPGGGLLVPTHRGQRGHPIVVAADLLAEIPHLDPAIGLRGLRERFPDRTRFLEVDDPGTVRDVDTPGDYAALQTAADPGPG